MISLPDQLRSGQQHREVRMSQLGYFHDWRSVSNDGHVCHIKPSQWNGLVLAGGSKGPDPLW